MKNKFTAKESKKQRQSRLDDFEFMDYCFKIIDMEINKRESIIAIPYIIRRI